MDIKTYSEPHYYFSTEEKEHVIDIISKELENGNSQLIVFSPIIVDEHIDSDGQPYLHTYIVFDEDESLLSPHWTSTLLARIHPELIRQKLPMVVSKSFISRYDYAKSDRKGMVHKKGRCIKFAH